MADPSKLPPLPLTRASVEAAHKLIEPYIHKTPVLTNSTLNRLASTPRTAAELEGTEWAGQEPAKPVLRFWFKCENFQKVGAFKARGAFHAIERLKMEPGPHLPEREAVTAHIISQTSARFIPPYNHPDIILGAGTAALELLTQIPSGIQLNAVITPCGGGGLLSGTALACSETSTLVFGAEPSYEGADDCRRGFASGTRVPAVTTTTIADGLRTPVGEIPWGIIYERKLVRGMYSVSEGEIRAAMRLVYERMKVVVEPSAVVGLAVALFNEEFRGWWRGRVGRQGGIWGSV
ncbi:hypothetical protein N0V88_000943 [Collariella sp. IMI 366227]|nr:hypothetical protein N0V88_000943 [Collariella sp. IMI 366227]